MTVHGQMNKAAVPQQEQSPAAAPHIRPAARIRKDPVRVSLHPADVRLRVRNVRAVPAGAVGPMLAVNMIVRLPDMTSGAAGGHVSIQNVHQQQKHVQNYLKHARHCVQKWPVLQQQQKQNHVQSLAQLRTVRVHIRGVPKVMFISVPQTLQAAVEMLVRLVAIHAVAGKTIITAHINQHHVRVATVQKISHVIRVFI